MIQPLVFASAFLILAIQAIISSGHFRSTSQGTIDIGRKKNLRQPRFLQMEMSPWRPGNENLPPDTNTSPPPDADVADSEDSYLPNINIHYDFKPKVSSSQYDGVASYAVPRIG